MDVFEKFVDIDAVFGSLVRIPNELKAECATANGQEILDSNQLDSQNFAHLFSSFSSLTVPAFGILVT